MNVIQSRLLNFESLILSLYTPMEIIIMVIVGHVSWLSPYLLWANCGRGGIAAGFTFIVWPLEKAFRWFADIALVEDEDCP